MAAGSIPAQITNFMNAKIKQIGGQRRGMLTAIEYIETANTHAVWRWRCDCGGEKVARANNVGTGKGQSSNCGCQDGRKRKPSPQSK